MLLILTPDSSWKSFRTIRYFYIYNIFPRAWWIWQRMLQGSGGKEFKPRSARVFFFPESLIFCKTRDHSRLSSQLLVQNISPEPSACINVIVMRCIRKSPFYLWRRKLVPFYLSSQAQVRLIFSSEFIIYFYLWPYLQIKRISRYHKHLQF